MKLSDITKGRPVICRFDDINDHHGGTFTKDPQWQENPYNSETEMLVITMVDKGITYELRARNQMIDAITAAAAAAGAESLEAGGYLDVTFVEYRGKLKVYRAVYEAPGGDHCGCADSHQEPIGTAALEFGADDPANDDQSPW